MWALVTTLITTLCCWTSFQFYWGIIHSWSGETWSQFTPWQQIFFFCCKGFHCWMVLVTNFNNRGKGLKKNHLKMWRGSSISMAGACRFFKNSVVLKFFILAHVQLFYQIMSVLTGSITNMCMYVWGWRGRGTRWNRRFTIEKQGKYSFDNLSR